MKPLFDNMVYVIGADHHTTLSVIRCLYQCRCNYRLVLHTGEALKQTKLYHSRYAKNTVALPEEESQILQWLLAQENESKALIIPASDLAALIVDKHAAVLCEKYHLPGFRNDPGKVCRLMDKQAQKAFADEHGIPMAASWTVIPEEGSYRLPEDLVYPCIVKPLLSAYGSKSSIFVAQDRQMLAEGLKKFNAPVLIQKFLTKQYELCAYGVMEEKAPYYRGGLVRKLHESINGSTIYARCIEDEEADALTRKICQLLWSQGYRGLYDFELLVCSDGVYLNEINFRNSGNGYALAANGIPAALIWCNSVLGIDNSRYNETLEVGSCHINDFYEIIHVKQLRISLWRAFCNIFTAKGRAVWDWRDLPGSMAFYGRWLKNRFFHR